MGDKGKADAIFKSRNAHFKKIARIVIAPENYILILVQKRNCLKFL
jgi:hypothetical protein